MKKTRIFSVFLSLIIFLQLFSNISFAKSFNDTDNNWSKQYIDYISDMGVINGYEDGSFKPNNNITRAEVLKLVSLYHTKNLNNTSSSTDVVPVDITSNYSWLTSEDFKNVLGTKYMSGYPDGTFKPGDNITRAEFAKTIYNMKDFEPKLPEISKSLLLTDINNHWANVPIRDLTNRGIINGYEDGSFRPDNYITRAEAVTVMAKFNGFTGSNNQTVFFEVFQNNVLIGKFPTYDDAVKEASKYANSKIIKNGETVWTYSEQRSDFTIYQDNVLLKMYEDGFDNLSDAVSFAILWSNSTIKQNGTVVWDFNTYNSSYNVYQGNIYLGSFSSLESAKTEALKWADSVIQKNNEVVWRFTSSKKLIVIDPGHGGPASGAVSASKKYLEKDLNLSVSLKLRTELEKKGYNVLMTRETDVLPFGAISDSYSLAPRINFANDKKADMFISVHFNSFGVPTASGIETFYEVNKPEDKPLAISLQNSLIDNIITLNRGVKNTNNSPLYVLGNSKVPAALVELGFISNPVDELTLVTDAYHNKAANALANGIDNYFK